jgi:hypothetical protein
MIPRSNRTKKGKGPAQRTRSSRVRQPSVWQSVSRLAPYALAAFKGAASLLNAEFKHTDVTFSQAVSTTATVDILTATAQGDGNTTRDGNSIKAKGLWGDVCISAHSSSTLTRVRLVFFVDTRNAGSSPTAGGVIDVSASCTGLPNVDSEPNRYAILSDQIHTLVYAGDSRIKHIRIDLTPQMMDMHLLYSGTTAVVGSVRGPHLFMLALSSEATNTASIVADFRLIYVDN